ncbi:hypothetical protein TcBrA4_0036350 [Trypanosoma cruzi]|nr:hypothetical protein TcBrA4_0036350 [Trypanosoma cruzi]
MNSTSLRHSVAAITAPRNPESIRASLKRKKHTTVWSKWAALEERQLALRCPYECARAQLEAKKYWRAAQMPTRSSIRCALDWRRCKSRPHPSMERQLGVH